MQSTESTSSGHVFTHTRNPTYERWRWQIFGITWLAYFGFYLTRKAFWVAKVDIGEGSAVGLTLTEMSGIEFGYGVCYAAGQFIFGMSGDLFTARQLLAEELVFRQ